MKENNSNIDKKARSILQQEMESKLAGRNKNIWSLVVEICGRHKSDYDAEKPFNSKNHAKTSKKYKE